MAENIKSKNLSGQDVIKEMRRVGTAVKGDLRKEMRAISSGVEDRLKKEIRETGVKIESIEHNVGLILDNQTAMSDKLDATFDMVGGLAEDMTIVKGSLNSLKVH